MCKELGLIVTEVSGLRPEILEERRIERHPRTHAHRGRRKAGLQHELSTARVAGSVQVAQHRALLVTEALERVPAPTYVGRVDDVARLIAEDARGVASQRIEHPREWDRTRHGAVPHVRDALDAHY